MYLHFFWLEPKSAWIGRGYANHQHLYVDFVHKTYTIVTNYCVSDECETDIQVKRKSDIKNLISEFDKDGFIYIEKRCDFVTKMREY
jgi:hypothetical protein